MPPNTSPSPADVLAALQRGGVIEVLKLLLAAKGVSSKGAKNLGRYVGSPSKPISAASPPSQASQLSPGEVPRSNKDIWLLLALTAALYSAYYFFSH